MSTFLGDKLMNSMNKDRSFHDARKQTTFHITGRIRLVMFFFKRWKAFFKTRALIDENLRLLLVVIMIRLPPTSISLSANDLDFHLHQINIYHGLLKQGFKKKDVLRYFEEQRQTERSEAAEHQQEESIDTPTTLELANRRLTSRGSVDDASPSKPTIRLVGKERSTSNLLECNESTEISDLGTTSHCFEAESPEADEADTMSETLRSLSLSSHIRKVNIPVQRGLSITSQNEPAQIRHAPRQSSLLRFARTISSDTSEAQGSSPFPALLDDVGLESTMEEQDEQIIHGIPEMFEEPVLDDSLALVMGKEVTSSRSSSSLDPGARDFTPSQRMPQFFAVQRIPSEEPSLPSVDRLQVHGSSNIDIQLTPSSISSDDTTQFRSSPPILDGSMYFPSSPPRAPRPLPHIPTTPTSRYNAARTESEPRDRRHQHMDGSTFTIYDDSVPIDEQPQTPADLSRRPLMNEYSAAYTAPPGMMYGAGIQRTPHESMLEAGEQSPTERAIEVRSRRNREFARSARVEGLRILRARRRVHRDPSASLDDNEIVRRSSERAMDFWREDLEADRVGEENFAEEADLLTRQINDGLRVVSGNERPRVP